MKCGVEHEVCGSPEIRVFKPHSFDVTALNKIFRFISLGNVLVIYGPGFSSFFFFSFFRSVFPLHAISEIKLESRPIFSLIILLNSAIHFVNQLQYPRRRLAFQSSNFASRLKRQIRMVSVFHSSPYQKTNSKHKKAHNGLYYKQQSQHLANKSLLLFLKGLQTANRRMANCKLQNIVKGNMFFSDQNHPNSHKCTQRHSATQAKLCCLKKIVFATSKHGISFQRWIHIFLIWLRDAFTAIQQNK